MPTVAVPGLRITVGCPFKTGYLSIHSDFRILVQKKMSLQAMPCASHASSLQHYGRRLPGNALVTSGERKTKLIEKLLRADSSPLLW